MCPQENPPKTNDNEQTSENNKDYDEWFRQMVERGILDAKLGRVLSHEEVEEEARRRREKLLQRLSK